jgi:hypothetical protein
MIKYGELNQALARYTKADIHEDISIDYYRRVIKAWFRANNKGLSWDVQQSASILIHLAFNEGALNPSQLNADGLKALDWGEKLLQQIKTDANKNKEVLDALKIA